MVRSRTNSSESSPESTAIFRSADAASITVARELLQLPAPPLPAALIEFRPNGQADLLVSGGTVANGGCSENDTVANGLPTDAELCERATLDELRAEGDTLLVELVGIFQAELATGLEELARALETRDCLTAARVAHKLKGAAGNVGANLMRELADSIDQAARVGDTDQPSALFEEFGSECERVRPYLLDEIKS